MGCVLYFKNGNKRPPLSSHDHFSEFQHSAIDLSPIALQALRQRHQKVLRKRPLQNQRKQVLDTDCRIEPGDFKLRCLGIWETAQTVHCIGQNLKYESKGRF